MEGNTRWSERVLFWAVRERNGELYRNAPSPALANTCIGESLNGNNLVLAFSLGKVLVCYKTRDTQKTGAVEATRVFLAHQNQGSTIGEQPKNPLISLDIAIFPL
jgi:hypothetical protein